MKVLLVGGHLSPALAIIDELVKKNDIEIVFVGRKYVGNSEKTPSLEYKEITKRNLKFYNLNAGRLTRIFSLRSLINLIKTPVGFFQSYKIISDEHPDLIMSFGGYLALPIAVCGSLKKIRVFTHEQTISAGLTNKIISLFASKIFVSFEETKKYFNQSKTIVSGNPIREDILKIIDKPFNIVKDRPIIYVTGGSLGSHSVNVLTESILNPLLNKYIVIHQTGNIKEYDDFYRLKKIKKSLPPNLSRNYFLVEHFFQEQLGYIYSIADLVISRAGANTFFELASMQKPTIFIPLPWSSNREQQKQAEIFFKLGCGEIFSQSQKPSELLQLINKMIDNLPKYKNSFINLNKFNRKDAAQVIIKEIC